MAGTAGEKEVPKKRSSKRFEGNDVKYCELEYVMSSFAALLRMETKILAQ